MKRAYEPIPVKISVAFSVLLSRVFDPNRGGHINCVYDPHDSGPKSEKRKLRSKVLSEMFDNGRDESGNPYGAKHVTAPRGSLILWDSRTIHWNQHASKERPYRDNPKVRMVGYLCYVPKARLTEEGNSTGHNPGYPELTYTKDHIWQEFKEYFEDASYIQPKIHLTPLGESLLGF